MTITYFFTDFKISRVDDKLECTLPSTKVGLYSGPLQSPSPSPFLKSQRQISDILKGISTLGF